MVNNHVQNSLRTVLQDEVSSQQRRTGQRGPQTKAIVNTNGDNTQIKNETGIVGPNGTKNTNGPGNGNHGKKPKMEDEDGTRPARTPVTTEVVGTILTKTNKEGNPTVIQDGTHL
ncbi:hypothetical protein A2U01_0040371 [Trifolium medium]|uniref:Uncharacterized protein n=1 Tax=Trifolium medium TaxID=97028 RepID=A0A392Q7H6_9FABA|nr:hypothetical protein [Trifolium medium]